MASPHILYEVNITHNISSTDLWGQGKLRSFAQRPLSMPIRRPGPESGEVNITETHFRPKQIHGLGENGVSAQS